MSEPLDGGRPATAPILAKSLRDSPDSLAADMSLRMWLAGQALNGSLSNAETMKILVKTPDDFDADAMLVRNAFAFAYADALIAETAK